MDVVLAGAVVVVLAGAVVVLTSSQCSCVCVAERGDVQRSGMIWGVVFATMYICKLH